MNNWFTGSRGRQRVSATASELNQLFLLDRIAEGLTDANQYHPWMSMPPKDLKIELVPQVRVLPTEPFRIVNNVNELQTYGAMFHGADCTPLKHLGVENSNPACILTDKSEILEWSHLVNEALEILQAVDPTFLKTIGPVCQEIIPLGRQGTSTKRRPIGRGLSSHSFRGGIFLEAPSRGWTAPRVLALNLTHEIGHQILMAYQAGDPIISNGLRYPIYSYIRQTNRPAIKSFHALSALLMMVDFLAKAHVSSALLPIEKRFFRTLLLQTQRDLLAAVKSFRDSPDVNLTQLGREILSEAEAKASECLLGSVA